MIDNIPNTTMTWAFGKECFYIPYGNDSQYLTGTANVTDLKIQFVGANQINRGGLPYNTSQAPKGSTFGNVTFDEEWERALAFEFSDPSVNL